MFVCSAALAAGAALAAVSMPQSVSSAQPQPVAVCYSGYVLLRMRPAAWGLSPAQRAGIVTQRFVRLVGEGFRALSRDIQLPRPHVDRCHGNWVVITGNVVLVTATSADAKANKTSAKGLAQVWARRLGHALGIAVMDVGRMTAGRRVSDGWIRQQLRVRMGPIALLPSDQASETALRPSYPPATGPADRLRFAAHLRAMLVARR